MGDGVSDGILRTLVAVAGIGIAALSGMVTWVQLHKFIERFAPQIVGDVSLVCTALLGVAASGVTIWRMF